MRRLTVCTSWAALAGLSLIAMVAVIWFARGGRMYSVPTGSMRPVFQPGDAVFTHPVSFEQLQPGQVISFRDRTQPWLITTHRIVSLDRGSGSLTTKGDHNPQPDLPISRQQIVGQATMVGPHLGLVLTWLRRPIGLAVAVYLPIIIIVYLEMIRWQHRRAIYYGR